MRLRILGWALVAVSGVLVTGGALPAAGGQNSGLIAFHKYVSEGIYVKAAEGGPARRVTRDGAGPVWSPDGKWFAFIAYRNIPKSHACRYDEDVACPTEIYIVRPNGTGERRITPSAVGVGAPAWSPDASKLAFRMNSRLYVIDLDGSGLRPLTKSKFSYESSPSWSPDGKEIAFVGNDDIYVTGLNGRQRRLTNSTAKREGGPYESALWSPDGRLIAYSGHKPYGQGFERLYVTDPLGKKHRLLTPVQLPVYWSYAWSPDSRRIAYRAGSEAEDKGLWVIHLPSGRQEQIAGVRGLMSWDEPSWSPTGDRLVAGQSIAGNPKGIWVMNADGSGKKQVVVRGHDAVWQPSRR